MIALLAATGALTLAAGAGLAQAQTPAQAQGAVLAKNDYADKANWLCWPGRDDACAGDNTATVIQADGAMAVETWAADPKAPVDCFYVYPTVSNDPGVVSDMTANAEERRVVEQQLSRLGAKCRVYAPLYRQFTLTALRALVTGGALPAGGQATPMTYEVDGRQYLVIMAGGHHFMETPVGDELIAYALPD